MNEKEIKRQIRALKRLKRDMRVKTEERRETNRKIRELKKELNKDIDINPEKTAIIEEIHKYKPAYMKTLKGFNMYRYTIEQLQFHLNKLKERGRK